MAGHIKKLVSLIERILGVLILIPHPTTIGNTAEEIYFGLIEAKRNENKLLIIRNYQILGLELPLANRELSKIKSQYIYSCEIIIVTLSIISTVIFASFRLFNKLRIAKVKYSETYTQPRFGRERLWNISAAASFIKNNYIPSLGSLEKLKIEVTLQDHSVKKCQNLLREMGITKDAWFVCLHVREGGFWRDENLSATRNASIENYIEAIK